MAALSLLALHACGGEGDADGGAGAYGDPCSGACAAGLSCVLDESFPGGYCASLCDGLSCPPGAICDDGRAPALCLRACASATACRDGYQ